MKRRRVLTGTAALVPPLIAGCGGRRGGEGDGNGGGGGSTPTESATGTPTETGTEQPAGTPTAEGASTATETPTGTPASGGTSTPRAATETSTIDMVNTAYDPVRARVDPGTEVTWTNKDSYGHTVTAAQFHDVAASWDLDADVSGGGSVAHTFDEAGVYEYYCTIHGKDTMCGVVLVGDATLEESLPCEGDDYGGY